MWGRAVNVDVLIQEAGNIVVFAVDDLRRLLFWANNARQWRAIYTAGMSGTKPTPIITDGLPFYSHSITHY